MSSDSSCNICLILKSIVGLVYIWVVLGWKICDMNLDKSVIIQGVEDLNPVTATGLKP